MKLIDKILLIYSTFLAIALTVTSVLSGFSLKNLVMIALFLPVTGYFIYQLVKAYKTNQHRRQLKTQSGEANHYQSFSIKSFLSQNNPSFLVTLSLYFALLAALIVKTIVTLIPVTAGS